MDLPKRKHPRLKNYDYSQNGCYHIIICVKNSHICLATVGRGLAPAEAAVHLTKYGEVLQSELKDLESRFECVTIDKYCIMPDHIHILLRIDSEETAGASPRPTVSDCVRIVKSIFTRKCNAMDGTAGRTIFQTSFYDEVIGSLSFCEQVWRYIDENPMKWLITHHKI